MIFFLGSEFKQKFEISQNLEITEFRINQVLLYLERHTKRILHLCKAASSQMRINCYTQMRWPIKCNVGILQNFGHRCL
jgi:hypothetical protein